MDWKNTYGIVLAGTAIRVIMVVTLTTYEDESFILRLFYVPSSMRLCSRGLAYTPILLTSSSGYAHELPPPGYLPRR